MSDSLALAWHECLQAIPADKRQYLRISLHKHEDGFYATCSHGGGGLSGNEGSPTISGALNLMVEAVQRWEDARRKEGLRA